MVEVFISKDVAKDAMYVYIKTRVMALMKDIQSDMMDSRSLEAVDRIVTEAVALKLFKEEYNRLSRS